MIEIPENSYQNLVKTKNQIKNNLPLLILIPTILGGLQQTIQLIIISPSLIRFFSISQLIADGLFILLYFTSIVILPLYIAKYIMKITNNLSNEIKLIISYFIIILQAINILIILFYNKETSSDTLLDFLHQVSIFFVFGCSIFLKIENNDNEQSIIKINKINWIVSLVIFFTGLTLSIIMFIKINITIPIDNFTKLEKKYGDIKNIEILYFNDKYIFLRVLNKSSDHKIHIEKLDTVL
ncbi:hypothetical protein [Flavobacterium sp. GCM10027622]|uniref:hypothetical protein n=1 Tax=unclassified Flavobacterium TaxID=196869 RepID=UPI003616277E